MSGNLTLILKQLHTHTLLNKMLSFLCFDMDNVQCFEMETKLFYYLLVLTLTPVLSAPPHPHIIVLLADDLGYNDVSWHNQHVLMPHLHDLATSGIILEQHYSQAVCSPTRGAFLTGRYPMILL